MSGRVCYIARLDRGDRISAIRLVGARNEEQWQAPAAAPDSVALLAETGEAADWIASRAGRSGISLLILDVGGGECRWVTAPAAEPAVVAAALSQSEWGDSHASTSSWGAPTLAEASVQALAPATISATQPAAPKALPRRTRPAPEETPSGQRFGALSIPDVSPRLLVDALDDRGVSVEQALSLWHALALAWDPAGPAASSLKNPDVVAAASPVTSIVLIDPSGRIVWSWARAGELLAGGTIRLPAPGGLVQVSRADIARLGADWLSWSVQLGQAPARIIALAPQLQTTPDSLSARDIGAELGKLWAGATVDLAVHEDPIGATLFRLSGLEEDQPLADAADDGRRTLLNLSSRPRRVHRSMYRWMALALLAIAIALTAIAWKAWSGASEARARARAADQAAYQAAIEAAPPRDDLQQATASSLPRQYLTDRLILRRREVDPTGGIEPVKPILPELEALSYVLGTSDIRLIELNMDAGGVIITVDVPDTRTGEELEENMGAIMGSAIVQWQAQWLGNIGEGRRQIILTGRWPDPRASRPAGGQS